jgi:predicted nucleotidyltransferase component of viral defense system
MTLQNNNFLTMVEKAMLAKGHAHMRAVIEKELLHYDILFALDNAGLLDKLTFQGGTSLRLCYGAPRFSEDLDFAGGTNFATKNLISMKTCIEQYLGKRYGLKVTVKEPHEMSYEPENRNIKISKWQIRIDTYPERPDLPKQMIKIEIGNIPAYTKEPQQLQKNYDFLPDGYNDMLIITETLEEILADKLISFVNCQAYIRYRDIWDLHWLKQQGSIINLILIKQKIDDYKIDNYLIKAKEMINALPDIIYGKTFKEQMSRFLPMNVQERTLLKEKFYMFLLKEISTMLNNLLNFVSNR